MNKYLAECDDFYVNVNLNTEMELPTSRDTVLHFFEQMKKRYPELRNFYTREDGVLVLEGDKEEEAYRTLAIEPRRLCSGHVNPATLDDAYGQHELVLELAPHLLTISNLDCEALDVMYGFDFDYEGNHDEIVAEALGVGPAFDGLVEVPRARVINFEPSVTIALDDSCRLQARISIETRTNAFQVRTGEFGDDQISIYFTIRQYWGNGPDRSFLDSFRHQSSIGEEIVRNQVVPRIVLPLARAIASRS
ncbi:hypothetical protein P12x_003988 [Tundrisphaera lichenicola]|uniref:hypothetical protein n=1 Tax=Tundrisphaera lichenicola TaxID=2029860 RepID=UPI003EBCC031